MNEPGDDKQVLILEEAVQQFVDSWLDGQEPDIDEFVRQYPGHEQQVRQRIRRLHRIDGLLDSLVRADDSDFQGTVSSPDLVGQKLGSFEVERVIGRGGMGVVYLARDTKLDRLVAIKSMPHELLADATAQMRFRREAKLLASLSHPNIAVIHDIIEDDHGAAYLVLEYVPGCTLAEQMAEGLVGLEAALSIGLQIAEAVSAAHDKGVVHRDLKPGNIKITLDSRVKVLDFGLAKAIRHEDAAGATTATHPGRMMGTPAYMSPEQIRGRMVDHRTDIWSFGCILFEMLTGQRPFEGQTVSDTIARTLEREPAWESLPPQTPENIRVLVRRCLQKDPHHRLQHAGDVALEIREALGSSGTGLSASARPFGLHGAAKRVERKLLRTGVIGAAGILAVVSILAARWLRRQEHAILPPDIPLVVSPFENLGPADDGPIATGVTEAVQARLSGMYGLGVISPQVPRDRQDVGKTVQQIGREVGAHYVLEATVRRERPSDPESRLRIIPTLIRTSDGRRIWSQPYDSNTAEAFRVESDFSEYVARAVDTELLAPLREAHATRATRNREAYDSYLRGNEYLKRGCYQEENARIALQMFQTAVDLDPAFAEAWAALSTVHINVYWLGHDRTETRRSLAWAAVDRARQLTPDLPDTHYALCVYYYWGHLDYDRALEHCNIALRSWPNSWLLYIYSGSIKRRQGRFDDALAEFEVAYELDPQIYVAADALAETYGLLRDYPRAEHYCRRAIALSPEAARVYGRYIKILLSWQGSPEAARKVLTRALENVDADDDVLLAYHTILLEMFDGNYAAARRCLDAYPKEVFTTEMLFYVPKAQLHAEICRLEGDQQAQRSYWDAARALLEARLEQQPNEALLHSALGIAYAGLGQKEDAVREGRLGVELLPVTKEAWGGLQRLEDLARVYTMVGEHDAALDQIEYLVQNPGELSVPLLRIDPAWDPLRDEPRFKRLLEREDKSNPM